MITCPVCGAENAEGARFCSSCGAELNEGPVTEQFSGESGDEAYNYGDEAQQKPAGRPKLIAAAAAVVVILAVAGFLIFRSPSSGGKFLTVRDPIIIYRLYEDEEMVLIRGAEDTGVRLDGYSGRLERSLQGKMAIFQSYYDEILTVIDGKQVKTLDEEGGGRLSLDGSKLAFVNDEYELWLYDCSTWKRERIAENLEDIVGLAISPDGGAVAYAIWDDDKYENQSFVWRGKAPEKLGKNLVPIGISAGGKYVYCMNDDNGSLYVVDDKGNSSKLTGGSDGRSITVYFNRDRTEMLFTYNESLYVTVKGGEKVKLAGKTSWVQPVVPAGTGVLDDSLYDYDYNVYSYVYGVSSFSDLFFKTGDKLIYVDKKWNPTTVVSGQDDCVCSKDGSAVLYTKNDRAYKVTAKTLSEPLLIAKDVYDAVLTSDGKAAYYVDEDDVLWYKAEGKDAKRIADDVDEIVITHDDLLLFTADYDRSSDSYTLYSCKGGGSKRMVSDDVYYFYAYGNTTYYIGNRSDEGADLYATAKGDDFKLIVKGIAS